MKRGSFIRFRPHPSRLTSVAAHSLDNELWLCGDVLERAHWARWLLLFVGSPLSTKRKAQDSPPPSFPWRISSDFFSFMSTCLFVTVDSAGRLLLFGPLCATTKKNFPNHFLFMAAVHGICIQADTTHTHTKRRVLLPQRGNAPTFF